uniref:Uncharacterized protein n=1 Tax=Nelumbo nucifera TaxID=4432 RepID=A0A822YZM6_NELNU|nr:TPA_asm: hypothetical protein HUJ06_007317 [Nelumbo nucifera]
MVESDFFLCDFCLFVFFFSFFFSYFLHIYALVSRLPMCIYVENI